MIPGILGTYANHLLACTFVVFTLNINTHLFLFIVSLVIINRLLYLQLLLLLVYYCWFYSLRRIAQRAKKVLWCLASVCLHVRASVLRAATACHSAKLWLHAHRCLPSCDCRRVALVSTVMFMCCIQCCLVSLQSSGLQEVNFWELLKQDLQPGCQPPAALKHFGIR